MSFFTNRERAELGKSAEITMERNIRDVVRSEFAPRRGRPDNDLSSHVGSVRQQRLTNNHLGGHVGSVRQQRPADNHLGGDDGSMLQQVAESSLREIDDLIVVLQRRREELLSESARVQRAVIEYAKLSQSTMQSARIITESLSHLIRVPVPSHKSESESHVGGVSNEAGETAVPASSDVSALPEEASGPNISPDGD
jgi:hypothetical protein